MKRRGKLVCCLSCGKDTMAPSGYCSQCFGGHHKQPDHKRRIVNGLAVEVEREKRTVAEEYNGESERDDI